MALTVLVVDDEQPIRKLIRLSLEKDGFAVTEASDAEDALGRLDDSICLLLSDLSMPGLSGLELVAEVLRRRPNLPVILMSGYSEAYAGQLGGHFCFKKPFELRALAKQIRKTLG